MESKNNNHNNKQMNKQPAVQKRKCIKPSRIATYNYKNLDEWLENSVKGIQLETDSPSSSALNVSSSPGFHLGPMGTWRRDPWALPPELNYLNLPGYSSPVHPLLNNHLLGNSNNNNHHHEFASLPPVLNTSTATTFGNGGSNNNNDKAAPSNADATNQNRMYVNPLDLQPGSSMGNSDGDDSGDSKSTSMSKTSLKLEEAQLLGMASTEHPSAPSNVTSMSESNKMLSNLIKQINLLHETNTQIFRKLQETKVEVDALKLAPNWGGMRHRRDSISGLSIHSQPLGPIGGGYGTQSPAPTYHSQGYTPGVVTDVIREVREGTRVREEALLNRVKSMIEERQWSINETNLRVVRELEELKIQMHQMKLDKKHTDDKLNRMEADISSLRNLITHSLAYPRQSFSEYSAAPVASPGFPDSFYRRSAHPQRLSFGTLNEVDTKNTFDNLIPSPKRNGRDSFCSDPENDSQMVQLERDTLELRRELQDAIASKKASESKIAQLEKLVSSLKHRLPMAPQAPPPDYTLEDELTEKRNLTSPTPQKASTVQAVTPKSILTNNLTLNGPVTDL